MGKNMCPTSLTPHELRSGLVHAAACTQQRQMLDCKRWTSLLSAAKGVGLRTAGEVWYLRLPCYLWGTIRIFYFTFYVQLNDCISETKQDWVVITTLNVKPIICLGRWCHLITAKVRNDFLNCHQRRHIRWLRRHRRDLVNRLRTVVRKAFGEKNYKRNYSYRGSYSRKTLPRTGKMIALYTLFRAYNKCVDNYNSLTISPYSVGRAGDSNKAVVTCSVSNS